MKIEDLNNTINQLDLKDIQIYSENSLNKSRIHIFLMCTWSIIQDILYVIHRMILNNFKKTKIIGRIFLVQT